MRTPEQEKHLREFIKLLLTTEKKQGKGGLRNGDLYCCQGLAAEMAGIPMGEKSSYGFYQFTFPDGNGDPICWSEDWARNYFGFSQNQAGYFWALNDVAEMSFYQIGWALIMMCDFPPSEFNLL